MSHRVPSLPRAYLVANFLTCNVGAWIVLFGIALINDRPWRLFTALAASSAGVLIGYAFNHFVRKAIRQAARDEVDAMIAEAKRLQEAECQYLPSQAQIGGRPEWRAVDGAAHHSTLPTRPGRRP